MVVDKNLVQPNLDYLETHYARIRQSYVGKWLLLSDGAIVAAFDKVQAVQRAAREKGLQKHLLVFIDR